MEKVSNFSKFIFNKINLCFSSNYKSKIFLRKLGVKNKKFWDLKFSQSENEKIKFYYLNKIIPSKNLCASSTLQWGKIYWYCTQKFKEKSKIYLQ